MVIAIAKSAAELQKGHTVQDPKDIRIAALEADNADVARINVDLMQRNRELEAGLHEATDIIKESHYFHADDFAEDPAELDDSCVAPAYLVHFKRLRKFLATTETAAEWGCSHTTNNGDRCVLPSGHGGNHSL
jgi:hypothetical protein